MDVREALDANRSSGSRHPWELARLEVVERLLRKHTRSFSGSRHVVLDIGCGDAFLVRSLATQYPQVSFLGVDTALTDEVRQVLGDRVCAPNLNLYQRLDKFEREEWTISVVLLLDVLEHMDDDAEFLHELVQNPSVRKGALFVITVPAFQFLFSSHDHLLNHYRRYCLRRLKRTVTNAGMRVITGGYFFATLLIPRLMEAALERGLRLGHKQHTDVSVWNGNAVLTSLLKTVLLTDFEILRFLGNCGLVLPGLSCYTVCQT